MKINYIANVKPMLDTYLKDGIDQSIHICQQRTTQEKVLEPYAIPFPCSIL